MKLRIASLVLTFLILLPLLVNFFGWNIYAYFNFGEKDLIFASAQGVSHNACAEHMKLDPDFAMDPTMEDLTKTIVDVGFIDVFLERRFEPMTPFTFRWIEPDKYLDYRGFEFPWLLLLLVPLTIFFVLNLRRGEDELAEKSK